MNYGAKIIRFIDGKGKNYASEKIRCDNGFHKLQPNAKLSDPDKSHKLRCDVFITGSSV